MADLGCYGTSNHLGTPNTRPHGPPRVLRPVTDFYSAAEVCTRAELHAHGAVRGLEVGWQRSVPSVETISRAGSTDEVTIATDFKAKGLLQRASWQMPSRVWKATHSRHHPRKHGCMSASALTNSTTDMNRQNRCEPKGETARSESEKKKKKIQMVECAAIQERGIVGTAADQTKLSGATRGSVKILLEHNSGPLSAYSALRFRTCRILRRRSFPDRSPRGLYGDGWRNSTGARSI